MEALRAGRSALRAPARQPPGLRTEGGCTLARGLEAVRTSGGRSFLTDTGADHLRSDRGGRRCAGAGWPVVGDIGRQPPERDLDSRRGRRARDLVGRLRRWLPAFPGMAHACSISWRGIWSSSGGCWVPSSAELRSVDLASGKTDSVLPGVSVTDYDMSRDEKEVAFTTTDSSGESQIWLASLDRRTPPRQIARGGDQVSFGADGDLVFRSLEGTKNFLVRIKKDGRGRERLTTTPILDKFGVSPDGEWVTRMSPGAVEDAMPGTVRSAHPRRRSQENLHPSAAGHGGLPTGNSSMWRSTGALPRPLRKDARDSRAGRQIAAGSSRFWNRPG